MVNWFQLWFVFVCLAMRCLQVRFVKTFLDAIVKLLVVFVDL